MGKAKSVKIKRKPLNTAYPSLTPFAEINARKASQNIRVGAKNIQNPLARFKPIVLIFDPNIFCAKIGAYATLFYVSGALRFSRKLRLDLSSLS